MKRQPDRTEDSWERDAVWSLLDQAPPPQAGPRFVADTLRAARLAGPPRPWWQRLIAPAPVSALAGSAALLLLALAWLGFLMPPGAGSSPSTLLQSAQAAEIQDIAETEALTVAVDHLDDFSDHELVSLIGF